MKALIVDDERHVREAIRLLVPWQRFGIETVLEADDGSTGIALIRSERPALVFTDMMMPVMGGEQLMAWMAEHAPESKIIVISGHDTFDFVRTAVKYGGMDYILKPIDAEQLTSAVERAVGSWRSEDASRQRARGQDIELNQLKPLYTEQLFAALLKGTGSAQEFSTAMVPHGMRLAASDAAGAGAADNLGGPAGTAATASLPQIRVAVLELTSAPPAIADKFGSSGRDLFAYAVANIVNEMLRERQAGHAFRHHAGAEQEIVLLFWDGAIDVAALLVEFNDALFAALKARLAIGVGGFAAFPAGLAASYRQARSALMQRNLRAAGKCIHSFDAGAASANAEPALFFSTYEERVRFAVQNGNPDGIRKALQPWFDALDQRSRVTPENLLLWRREFQLAASIWESSAKVEAPYAGDGNGSGHVPIDAGGAFDYMAWKEAFVREACEIANRLHAGTERNSTSTIRDIASHIEKYAHEDLTLQSISDRFHLSREYISRKFKQDLGQNVSDFITECRINRAKILLASAQLRITQIAEMAGFQDEKYFSKVFKKCTDCTPSEFRKRQYGME
ncbi:response regulator [Paenibacillus silvisoli]|uniref:response regulator n=1 Tax=Paenibacillus silvisoli TaxID=3110539 RepID=UPI002805C108|nr:response regulator [Paenibacillus silvisoli]